MSEKKYFRYKSDLITVIYAFPAKIKSYVGSDKAIETFGFNSEQMEGDEHFEQITEAEFLEVFHEAQNEITLRYHRQFASENDFIRNESLKSEGY